MAKRKKAHISEFQSHEKRIKPAAPQQGKRATVGKIEVDSLHPKWAFHRMDWGFSVDLEAAICRSGQLLSSGSKIECCFHSLSQRLRDFEAQSWGEIKLGDNNGSHYVSIDELRNKHRGAVSRLETMAKNEGIEQLFSLRIDSEARLWGVILEDGTFEALWYDPHHKVWPTSPRGT